MHVYHLRLNRLRGDAFEWRLDADGGREALRLFGSKRAGVQYGLSHIERHGGAFVVHRLNGTIQERYCYPGRLSGSDPLPGLKPLDLRHQREQPSLAAVLGHELRAQRQAIG